MKAATKSIALFASGTGSNVAKIIEYFSNHDSIRVGLVVSNRKKAGVHLVAESGGVPSIHISRDTFTENPPLVMQILQDHSIDFIALAGFLLLVPGYLVDHYTKRMVNIHPALLPSFGGKGMYGMNVHRAVREANARESGMTIHYVDGRYDEGNVVFQARCTIAEEDSPEEIQQKVLHLEHKHYAPVIESLVANL